MLGAAIAFQADLEGTEAQAQLFASVNGRSGPWFLLWEARHLPMPGPARVVVDARALAGYDAVCVSFRYSAPNGDGWWTLDDLELYGEEDEDGDGLSDWWEILHFGSIAVQDGDDDFDGDEVTNLQEFRAGSAATDPESRPDILGMRVQGGRPVLQFEGSPERLYDIKVATLPSQEWQPAAPPVLGMGGLQESFVEESVPGDTCTVFRLRIRSY